jgi:hypothetical protein
MQAKVMAEAPPPRAGLPQGRPAGQLVYRGTDIDLPSNTGISGLRGPHTMAT